MLVVPRERGKLLKSLLKVDVDDSGESVWEYPGVWREVESKEHGGRVYYFNKETGESVWEQPEELAWKRVKVDPSEL